MGSINLGEVLLELLKYYADLDTTQFAIACRMPGSTSEARNVYPCNDTNVCTFYLHVLIFMSLLVQLFYPTTDCH